MKLLIMLLIMIFISGVTANVGGGGAGPVEIIPEEVEVLVFEEVEDAQSNFGMMVLIFIVLGSLFGFVVFYDEIMYRLSGKAKKDKEYFKTFTNYTCNKCGAIHCKLFGKAKLKGDTFICNGCGIEITHDKKMKNMIKEIEEEVKRNE